MNGVINFYKPPGMTSAQAVAFVKRLTGVKTGHAGTLDPEAAGVLPILLGRATRLCDELMGKPKQYLAELAFGAATDTQDAQGRLVASGDDYPDIDKLRAVLPQFVGLVQQLPPQYSALKVKGKTAYKLAREGVEANLKPREVYFESIELIRELPSHGFLLRVRCGKGAYLRTLCHDLGTALGCPAHLRFLLREESGGLRIERAVTPEELLSLHQDDEKTNHSMVLPVGEVLRHLPAFQVPPSLFTPAINGVPLPPEAVDGFSTTKHSRVCLFAGERLIGIYELKEGLLRVQAMFYEPEQQGN